MKARARMKLLPRTRRRRRWLRRRRLTRYKYSPPNDGHIYNLKCKNSWLLNDNCYLPFAASVKTPLLAPGHHDNRYPALAAPVKTPWRQLSSTSKHHHNHLPGDCCLCPNIITTAAQHLALPSNHHDNHCLWLASLVKTPWQPLPNRQNRNQQPSQYHSVDYNSASKCIAWIRQILPYRWGSSIKDVRY